MEDLFRGFPSNNLFYMYRNLFLVVPLTDQHSERILPGRALRRQWSHCHSVQGEWVSEWLTVRNRKCLGLDKSSLEVPSESTVESLSLISRWVSDWQRVWDKKCNCVRFKNKKQIHFYIYLHLLIRYLLYIFQCIIFYFSERHCCFTESPTLQNNCEEQKPLVWSLLDEDPLLRLKGCGSGSSPYNTREKSGSWSI